MLKKSVYFLFHPAVLGFIVTAIVILSFPPMFDKYEAEIVDSKKISHPNVYSYHDLNLDGSSEEVWYFGPPENYPSFIVYDNKKILDQWNFEGTYFNGGIDFYCDYNGDSISEIFVFIIKNDSIFLFGINPYKINEAYFVKQFIDKCSRYDNEYHGTISFCNTPDINNDGYKELVFAINTGMSIQPRNLYTVDIINNTVNKSPESGTGVNNPIAFDINNNGHKEYLGRSCAFGNIHGDSIDFPDNHAWLMVLDKNMNFLFDPPKFGQYKTVLDVIPFSTSFNKYLFGLQIHHGTENIGNKLILFNTMGNVIQEKQLENTKNVEASFLLSTNQQSYNDLYLFLGNGQIKQFDSAFNILKTFSIPDIAIVKPIHLDIDNDGKDEHIFSQKDYKGIVITRNDFSNPVQIEFTQTLSSIEHFSIIKWSNNKANLYFQINGTGFYVEYKKNPLSSVKYLIWLALYLVITAVLFVLQKAQSIRAKKKFETQQKIAELQLKSIKGQTDPHFTLNLIDSIGNLFYKNDSEKAGYVFGKYAKLLRTTILSAEHISVSLNKELEYVKNYIDLEKFRYDDKFDYSIELDNSIDVQIKIPKMLIHTFVENAIKHGLKHKEGWGKLEISIENQNRSILIRIKDNGVGRQKAKDYSKLSTGKGLQILDNILELYFELRKSRISYQITDIYSNEEKTDGTLVTINIPLKGRK